MWRNRFLNSQGQVLILFVILLPVILLVVYALFSYFNLRYEQKNLNHIAKVACEHALTGKSKDEVQKLIFENDADVIMEKIEGNTQKQSVTLQKEVDTLFLNYKTTVRVSTECSR